MNSEKYNANLINSGKVSVIITAYNRISFIHRAIESVLKQTINSKDIEIIVVSNTDFNINVPSYFKFYKIIMEGTIGDFLARAITLATGDIISFLDDDDLWNRDKLKRIIEAFSDEKIVFYHNLYSYIDSNGEPINFVRKVEKDNKNSFHSKMVFNPTNNIDKLKLAIKMKADFNLSCIAVRKSLAHKYIDILKMITSAPDGFFFWIAIISREYLFIDNKCLTDYRVHSLNVSGSKNLEHKATELQKQIMTFNLLINMITPNNCENNYTKDVKEWLKLYKYEYQIMILVFSDGGKLTILNNIISVLHTGIKTWNILKSRVILFGVIAIISSRFAKSVYIKI